MKLKLVAITVFLAALGTFSRADEPVTFTVTATADVDGYGYTSGQAYTFSYVLQGGVSVYTRDTTNPTVSTQVWSQSSTEEAQLFATLSGSGILSGGNYLLPPGNVGASVSLSFDSVSGLNHVDLATNTLFFLGQGLKTVGGTGIKGLTTQFRSPGGTSIFNYTQDQADPAVYFVDYGGDYSGSGTLSVVLNASTSIPFTVTGLQISPVNAPSAVPEPATYGACVGVVVLGLGLFRRRRGRG